jgi:hypothetical protein
MKKIGFATGDLKESLNPPLNEMIKIIKDLGCNAIEISLHEEDFKEFRNLDKSLLNSFDYKSLHAPEPSPALFKIIVEFYEKIRLDNIVFHPDSVKDRNIFDNFSNLPFSFENMDRRKTFGKNVEDMEEFLKNEKYKFVLDVNHCYTNDKTMKLANYFYVKFKDKISEIHLSGFEVFHEPLFKTKQIEILDAVPRENIPIIIESMCNNIDEMREELKYIKDYLKLA